MLVCTTTRPPSGPRPLRPATCVTSWQVRSVDERAAGDWAGHLVERLRQAAEGMPDIRVLGPAPAPIARLRDRFRWHVQAHGPEADSLRAVVRRAAAAVDTPAGVAWIVDVDPVEML